MKSMPGSNLCGGSILNENTVLTAAHCCDGLFSIHAVVVAGDHSLQLDEGTEQLVEVERIISHAQWDPITVTNDICLLKLKRPLQFNQVINAVTLPDVNQDFQGMGTVSGWGLGTSLSPPDILHIVEVPLLDLEMCRSSYGAEQIADSMICAGEPGRDACQGDDGGPLICDSVHCGIVSWGYGCGMPGYPGVYTRTSSYLNFIQENLDI